MLHKPLRLLGGLSPDQFLQGYWQKKPLLIRGAWTDFADPLSPEELAGLACEKQIEANLILEKGRAKPWELRSGLFMDNDFINLLETHWILLVRDMEKQLPSPEKSWNPSALSLNGVLMIP